MELTQRFQCSQDVNDTTTERTHPEQIGFLGIYGMKHPVKKGPNKIGRDPQTCNIVLDNNSISRQHAVINILNKKNFMVMDLDSSNKSKVLDITLQPYMPHPLKNGDTLQFGNLFGVFRLLEEDEELPMTQAVDILDTPVNIRHVSKLKTAPVTTIPESPDVSDKDDSIIVKAQKNIKYGYKNLNDRSINKKSSENILGNKPVSSNKIDNMYWSSSKKSDSFNAHFADNSMNARKDSMSPNKVLQKHNDIFDLDTQPPVLAKKNESIDTLHDAHTQVPLNLNFDSRKNIENLPKVFKVSDQNDMQLNLYANNNGSNLFEADTQFVLQNKENKSASISSPITKNNEPTQKITNKNLNSSDEEICFEEIDSEPFGGGGSQPLLESLVCENNDIETPISKQVISEDIPLRHSQVAPEEPVDGDETDFEDNMIVLGKNSSNSEKPNKKQSDDDITDCEDESTNINVSKQKIDDDATDCEDDFLETSQKRFKSSFKFEDLPTQVIAEDKDKEKCHALQDDVLFEDMATQVIEENCTLIPPNNHMVNDINNPLNLEDFLTQVIPEEPRSKSPLLGKGSPFKVPRPSPQLIKNNVTPSNKQSACNDKNEIDNYYEATQDILLDLCSQYEPNCNIINLHKAKLDNNIGNNNTIEKQSSTGINTKEKIEIMSDIVIRKDGKSEGTPLTKHKSSDSSGLDVTPTKFDLANFMSIDLPSTQEIKSCKFVTSETKVVPAFEDSEEDEKIKDSTLGVVRRKRSNIKQNLSKKFCTSPVRTTTRTRKPTAKILNIDDVSKENSDKNLQSKISRTNRRRRDCKEFSTNSEQFTTNTEVKNAKNNRLSDKKDKEFLNSERYSKRECRDKKVGKEESHRKIRKETSRLKGNKDDQSDGRTLDKNPERELKQRSINSMLIDTKANDIIENRSKDIKTENRRSARNKNKGDKIEKVVEPVKIESLERKSKAHEFSNTKEYVESFYIIAKDAEPLIRRSKRHQTNKESNENKNRKTKHGNDKNEVSKEQGEPRNPKRNTNKKSTDKTIKTVSNNTIGNKSSENEQSAVYDVSLNASCGTNLKRQANSDIGPTTKRAKPSTSLRPTTVRRVKMHVLFTSFAGDKAEITRKLRELGASVVSDIQNCTVMLTSCIRRTFKVMCAVGLGKPIVGPNWVQACVDSNMMLDPWLYLVEAGNIEKQFSFNLLQSLTCPRNFLKGYNISCTPNVNPPPDELKVIVQCSGGTWAEGGKWLCVTCPTDAALEEGLRRRGARLVTPEAMLRSILQQKLSPEIL